ncbi:MAG: GNAT family N-acetyltransferase [Gammaproteobacteria bacterium]|nr:GNAT family N-acetyltransferase [Gammaproteobacteria bacterium]
MNKKSRLASLTFTTARLNVANVESSLATPSSKSALLTAIVRVFSPLVVQSLPDNFHDIETESQAELWLDNMLADSHLFTVTLLGHESAVGFVFLYPSDDSLAHLGYLLAEQLWHQGYGSELLFGLIECCRADRLIDQLAAGVDVENIASARLLQKVGFELNETTDNGISFYQYSIA